MRGDRIVSATCYLPLSDNMSINKELGTRHRAGIGITEHSDALVLIVSEETGIISMARDGKLERFLDSRTIEKKLLEFYLKGGDFSEKIVPMAKILVGRVKDRRGNDAKE